MVVPSPKFKEISLLLIFVRFTVAFAGTPIFLKFPVAATPTTDPFFNHQDWSYAFWTAVTIRARPRRRSHETSGFVTIIALRSFRTAARSSMTNVTTLCFSLYSTTKLAFASPVSFCWSASKLASASSLFLLESVTAYVGSDRTLTVDQAGTVVHSIGWPGPSVRTP